MLNIGDKIYVIEENYFVTHFINDEDDINTFSNMLNREFKETFYFKNKQEALNKFLELNKGEQK